MSKTEKHTYILCIADDRDFERLRTIAAKEAPGAECVLELPVGYLTTDTEVVCGFFVGNGNIRDAQGNQTERTHVFSAPVRASDHWTPGGKGRFGSARVPDICSAISAAIGKTFETTRKPANVCIRHYDERLTLGYG